MATIGELIEKGERLMLERVREGMREGPAPPTKQWDRPSSIGDARARLSESEVALESIREQLASRGEDEFTSFSEFDNWRRSAVRANKYHASEANRLRAWLASNVVVSSPSVSIVRKDLGLPQARSAPVVVERYPLRPSVAVRELEQQFGTDIADRLRAAEEGDGNVQGNGKIESLETKATAAVTCFGNGSGNGNGAFRVPQAAAPKPPEPKGALRFNSVARGQASTLDELKAILGATDVPHNSGGGMVGIEISASLAGEIFKHCNQGNRKFFEVDKEKYMRDMKSGEWLPGRVVGFFYDGKKLQLGDGQHGFAAQRDAGIPMFYWGRVFNEQSEFDKFVSTVDIGRARTIPDLLTLIGVTKTSGSAQDLSRIINAMISFLGIKPSSMSPSERIKWAERRLPALQYALGLPKRAFKAHLLGCIAFAYTRHPESVTQFVGRVVSGANLEPNSPALVFAKAMKDWNDARKAADKDRVMGIAMRVIFDGITNAPRSNANRVQSSRVGEAISYLVSPADSEKWVTRREREAR